MMSNWFVELHLFVSADPMPLIYGYAQPVEREARPWHAEELPDCKHVLVARGNLSSSEFALFEQGIDGTGSLELSIQSPKKRTVSMALPGFSRRPPVLLRTREDSGYELSPTGAVAWCVERWNLDKQGLLEVIATGTSDPVDRHARIRDILESISRETGVALLDAAMPRLGNFDRIDSGDPSLEAVVWWKHATETPDLPEPNGIEIELAPKLATGTRHLIIETELRNGDVATRHNIRRWSPGHEKSWSIFSAEPLSSAHVKVFDETTGLLLGEIGGVRLRSIGGSIGAVSGTTAINDQWMRRLQEKTPGATSAALANVGSVQRVSHTLPLAVGTQNGADPWINAAIQARSLLGSTKAKHAGLFLPRETGPQEAEAFQSIRRIFDTPWTVSVKFLDPYFNPEGIKLLLRLEHPFPLRVLTSLKSEAWDAFREQLRKASDYLHPQLQIYQARNRAGDQAFHDRYLIVESQHGRSVYALTNSFAALGAKHPIVVVPLEGEVAVKVENYASHLFGEAGAPWWPVPAVTLASVVVDPDPVSRLVGGQLLSGVLGEPLGDPRNAVLRITQDILWERLAKWLAQSSLEILPARYLLNFLAGHVPTQHDWPVAIEKLRQANVDGCARTLESCLREELASIQVREGVPLLHRDRLYPLAELIRRWARDEESQVLAFGEMLKLPGGFGPPYDYRYGARLALRLLLQLKPDSLRILSDNTFSDSKARAAAQLSAGEETNVADEPLYLRAASLLWYLLGVADLAEIQVLENSPILVLRQLFATTLAFCAEDAQAATIACARIQAANWPLEERIAALFGVARAPRDLGAKFRQPAIDAIAALLPDDVAPIIGRVLFERSDKNGRWALYLIASHASLSRPAALIIWQHLISSFEASIVEPTGTSSAYFGETDLDHMEYAVKGVMARPSPDAADHGETLIRRFRRIVARLEHPRTTIAHSTEWRARMAVGSIILCYLLRIAEEIFSISQPKGIKLAKAAKAVADRAFVPFVESYSHHAFSPLPAALSSIWKRWMTHSPEVFSGEI